MAFKLGYAMTQAKYYSWLGGVHPAARRQGLAALLMEKQHGWVASRGYRMIETSTDEDNVAMSRLNLAHGFEEAGWRQEPGRRQTLFIKALN